MPLRVTMSDSSINGDAIFRDKSIVQLFFGHTLFVNINVEVAFLNMKLSHVEKEKKLPRVVKGNICCLWHSFRLLDFYYC